MEITEATPVSDAKWPLWTWFAYPALAIAIGGGLGLLVGTVRQHGQPSAPVPPPPEQVVAAPQPSTPSPSSPEIEFRPEPVKAATPRPKARPKPTKSTRCNVYDHMNGC